jgi:hypothetical protein
MLFVEELGGEFWTASDSGLGEDRFCVVFSAPNERAELGSKAKRPVDVAVARTARGSR